MGTLEERAPEIYNVLKNQENAKDKWLPNVIPDGKYGKTVDYCAGKNTNFFDYYPPLSETFSPDYTILIMMWVVGVIVLCCCGFCCYKKICKKGT